MGVKDLWSLLEPCGVRVNVEGLQGKRLAVDTSIWLVQCLKAMRDRHTGEVTANAHVRYFFGRVERLLYHRIRPVFVFDGGTPQLKRRTVAARRRRANQQEAKYRKQAERLLLHNLLLQRATQAERQAEAQAAQDAAQAGDAAAAAAVAARQAARAAERGQPFDPAAAAAAAARRGKGKAPALPASSPEALPESRRWQQQQQEEWPGGVPPEMLDSDESDLSSDDGDVDGESPMSRAMRLSRRDARRDDVRRRRTISAAAADPSASGSAGPNTQADELLAASLAAQEATRRGASGDAAMLRGLNAEVAASRRNEAREAAISAAEERAAKGEGVNDGEEADELYALPSDVSSLDPVALATLPQSVQQELLEQLREQQTARNRSTYYGLRKDAMAFSQTQMSKYVQAAGFKAKLEKAKAAMGGPGGAQGERFGPNPVPRRLAADPNREVVFTKSRAGEGVAPLASLREGTALHSLATGTKMEHITEMYTKGHTRGGSDSRPGMDAGGFIGLAGDALGRRGRRGARDEERDVGSAFRPDGGGLQDALAVDLATGRTVLPSPTGGSFGAVLSCAPRASPLATKSAMLPPPPREPRWDAPMGAEEDLAVVGDSGAVAAPSAPRSSAQKGVWKASINARADTRAKERREGEPMRVKKEGAAAAAARSEPAAAPEAINAPPRGGAAAGTERAATAEVTGTDELVVVATTEDVFIAPVAGNVAPDADTVEFMNLLAAQERAVEPAGANGGGGGGGDSSDDSDEWEEAVDDEPADDDAEGAEAAPGAASAAETNARDQEEVARAVAAAAEGVVDEVDPQGAAARLVVLHGLRAAAYASVAGFLSATADIDRAWPNWLPDVDELMELDGTAEAPLVEVAERTADGRITRRWPLEMPVWTSLAAVREDLAQRYAEQEQAAVDEVVAQKHAQGAAQVEVVDLMDDDHEADAGRGEAAPMRISSDDGGGDVAETADDAGAAPPLAPQLPAEALPSAPQPSAAERLAALSSLRDQAEANAAELAKDVNQRRPGQNEGPTPEMYEDIRELFDLFGVPYIDAPMEAEAQCAALEAAGLVDGVVTDDSDAFLFGARHVYRHIFDDKRYVESYNMGDVESKLNLDRSDLICLALLLGCDYTEGVRGVGIVNAYETVVEHRGLAGLRTLKAWVDAPDAALLAGGAAAGDKKALAAEAATRGVEGVGMAFAARHRTSSKNWEFPPAFPSEVVYDAFDKPRVSVPKAAFEWATPDANELWAIAVHKLAIDEDEARRRLGDMMRRHEERATQTRVDSFFERVSGPVAKFRSKRMHAAVRRGGGDEATVDEVAKAVGKGKKKGGAKKRPAVSTKDKEKQAAPKRSRRGGAAADAVARARAAQAVDGAPDSDDDADPDFEPSSPQPALLPAAAGVAPPPDALLPSPPPAPPLTTPHTRPPAVKKTRSSGLNDVEAKLLSVVDKEGEHGIGVNELSVMLREYNKKQLRDGCHELVRHGLLALRQGASELFTPVAAAAD